MPASCMAPALITAWIAVARNPGGIVSATGGQFLHHADLHATGRRAIQLHVVHEAAHEEDAASARLQNIFRRERVRHFLRPEPLPLIRDAGSGGTPPGMGTAHA